MAGHGCPGYALLGGAFMLSHYVYCNYLIGFPGLHQAPEATILQIS